MTTENDSWMSVEEMLPKNEELCLVCINILGVKSTATDKFKQRDKDHRWLKYPAEFVTHWKPFAEKTTV